MDDSVVDGENKELVEDWDLFKTRLREIFSPSAEVTHAEQKIQSLRQTRSAADYTTQFQQYAELVQWDDNALKRMYKQGLKPSVRAELMRTGVAIHTVQDLYKEAIRLDNQIYELAIEEKSFRRQLPLNESQRPTSQYGRKHQPNHGRQRNQNTPYKGQGYYRSQGPEPMHLDNIVQGKHTPTTQDKKRTFDKKNIECYACGKKGHMSRDCRSKNKVTRQLNTISKGENEPIENWTVISPPQETTPSIEQIFDDTSSLDTDEIRQELARETRVSLQESEEILQQLTQRFKNTGINATLEEHRKQLNNVQRIQDRLDKVTQKNDDTWDDLAEYITEAVENGIVMKNTTTTYEGAGWTAMNDRTMGPDSPASEGSDRSQYIEPHPGNRIHGP